MLTELIATYAPGLIAAIVLIPVIAFQVAMFFERTKRGPGGTPRRAPGEDRSAQVARPLPRPRLKTEVQAGKQPALQTESYPPVLLPGAGGLGLRRVTAARHEHD